MREWLSWWSTTLPRSGSRVRVPSRALKTKRHPDGCLFCFKSVRCFHLQNCRFAGSQKGPPDLSASRALYECPFLLYNARMFESAELLLCGFSRRSTGPSCISRSFPDLSTSRALYDCPFYFVTRE